MEELKDNLMVAQSTIFPSSTLAQALPSKRLALSALIEEVDPVHE